MLMNSFQALQAMKYFLYHHYQITQSDDIGSLGGDLNLCNDDKVTFDPASWDEWLEFTQKKQSLTSHEAFEAMVKFIDNYRINTKSEDLAVLLSNMHDGVGVTKDTAQLWDSCVLKALQENVV